MSATHDQAAPLKRVRLLKPHRHGGRDYLPGHCLALPAHKADWLTSTGVAEDAPTAPPAPQPKSAKE